MNQSSTVVCALLAAAWLSVGCTHSTSDAQSEETGTLGLPLQAHANSGVEYRLRNAQFELMGFPSNCYEGEPCDVYSETISSEDYLDADSITLSLREGSYDIFLQPNWEMERLNEDGTSETVEAVLLNGSYQWAWVSPHSTTWVSYKFGIGDEELWLNGQVNLTIDVYEDPSEYYHNGPLPGFFVEAGGYVTSGDWHGYAWTGTDEVAGSTITPTDFESISAGESLCVSGRVGADPDYGGFAMLGLNLNQDIEGDASESSWTPWGAGIAYDIADAADSVLRILLVAEQNDADATWCAPVTAGSGIIAWSDFNTQCWDNMGEPYDGMTPLKSAIVFVPGSSASDVPFDFCLNGLGPV